MNTFDAPSPRFGSVRAAAAMPVTKPAQATLIPSARSRTMNLHPETLARAQYYDELLREAERERLTQRVRLAQRLRRRAELAAMRARRARLIAGLI